MCKFHELLPSIRCFLPKETLELLQRKSAGSTTVCCQLLLGCICQTNLKKSFFSICEVRETVRHFSLLESIYPVIRPLTFSNICGILKIFAPYIQQIVSMFWITPPVVSNLRQDRLFIFKKKQPPLNQHLRYTNIKLSL